MPRTTSRNASSRLPQEAVSLTGLPSVGSACNLLKGIVSQSTLRRITGMTRAFPLLDLASAANYPKGLPFPTKRFARQEKADNAALQASLHNLVETKLISATFRHFVTRMALQASLPMWQTFW